MRVQKTRGVAQPGLARLLGVQEVAGSNPVAPIYLCGRNALLVTILWPRRAFGLRVIANQRAFLASLGHATHL